MAESLKVRQVRDVLADAYSFVRSMEVNSAFATVTIEELMGDQIRRNGESKESNASQYNPYDYDESKTKPAGKEPPKRVNFLGGSDTYRPTKLDRILAIQNSISSVITELKKMKPEEVATTEEYNSSGEEGIEMSTSELQWPNS